MRRFTDGAVVSVVLRDRPFDAYNATRPYSEQIRPWNFLLVAHVHPYERALGAPDCLVAPFTRNPAEWMKIPWLDRTARSSLHYTIRTGYPEHRILGAVAVQSLRELFDDYRIHPETKLAGADGKPCQPWTTGLLQPRPIIATGLKRIGKETNRLAQDAELLDNPEDRAIEYPQSACVGCGLTVPGRRKWCSNACRMRAARARRQDR